MKKFLFILLLFITFISSSQALSKFYLGEKVLNMYIEEYDDYNLHNGAPYVLRRDDGEIVYCINPFEYMSTTDYYQEYTYNASIFNLTEEQLDRMNVIAYYGYNYKNHTDLKWYGISQFLIWKTLNLNDIYFTDKHYGVRINAYEEEVNELETLVNNYYKLPSFSNEHFEYDINSNYRIKDLNKVLKYYEILESNISAEINNNELYINTKEDGFYEIKFIRKSPASKNYLLYNLNGAQDVLYPGKMKDIEFKITIEVNSGSVTINKFDSENKERLEATLEGAIYGLYQNDNLIATIETNKDGVGYIDNLLLGKYYIQEITPSIGYELDPNIYYFDITKENKDITINSYENIIKGNLIINKYYGEESNYKLEDSATFEIYDINDNLINTYETKNGIIDEEIDYGDYYIVQTSGIDGYKFIDKFNLSIKENKKYIFDLYDKREVLIVDVPDTYIGNSTKKISPFIIILGSIFIIFGIKRIKYNN